MEAYQEQYLAITREIAELSDLDRVIDPDSADAFQKRHGFVVGDFPSFDRQFGNLRGGSFRGELGATMTPGENSPWKLDLNVTGFAGKKQGFTGGVSVAFMF